MIITGLVSFRGGLSVYFESLINDVVKLNDDKNDETCG